MKKPVYDEAFKRQTVLKPSCLKVSVYYFDLS